MEDNRFAVATFGMLFCSVASDVELGLDCKSEYMVLEMMYTWYWSTGYPWMPGITDTDDKYTEIYFQIYISLSIDLTEDGFLENILQFWLCCCLGSSVAVSGLCNEMCEQID
jgi:hypothetical protein